jgi:hypothetical protein
LVKGVRNQVGVFEKFAKLFQVLNRCLDIPLDAQESQDVRAAQAEADIGCEANQARVHHRNGFPRRLSEFPVGFDSNVLRQPILHIPDVEICFDHRPGNGGKNQRLVCRGR